MNNADISGRIGQIPELRKTPTGKSVTSFDIAVKRPMTKDQVDWLTVVCWGQSAEYVCMYGEKGRHIEATGTIQTRTYTDKNGNKRTVWEIVATNVSFTESKNSSDDKPSIDIQHEDNTDDFEEVDGDDSLPFNRADSKAAR